MCRLAAWQGAPIPLEEVIVAPPHSLLQQSQDANEAKLAINGDGFGIAWYDADGHGPGLYRDVLPAWSDGNLTSLCQMIRAPLFMAHIRASTVGETARVNCHPFRSGCWSFMHNGQIGGFLRKRRALEALLPDHLYNLRAGGTDSEVLFLLLLAHGLKQDPLEAVRKLLAILSELRDDQEPPDRLTCVFSDGQSLSAFRYASDKKCPTLYVRRAGQGTVLASEPLDGEASNWEAISPDALVHVVGGEVHDLPLCEKQMA